MLFWYFTIVQIENCPESFRLKFGLMSQLSPLLAHFDFLLDEVSPVILCQHHLELFNCLLVLLLFAPSHEIFDKLAHFWLDS